MTPIVLITAGLVLGAIAINALRKMRRKPGTSTAGGDDFYIPDSGCDPDGSAGGCGGDGGGDGGGGGD